MEIGQKIRFLRQQNNLTQEELGDRCELSKGFISMLENDNTSPSIATLKDILEALGTNLADFFADEEQEKVVFGGDDYAVKEDAELKNNICWLIPNAQKNEMEPILVTIEPDGRTYPDNPHEGEEIGYVLEGSVMIHIGKNMYQAKKGESFLIRPDRPHYISNEGKKTAKILWISTPPSF
ncbi:MAG: cupin domain-containing protein [Saccharofermentans sp.]|nr:cupin domain-containing protein [Saccharofermentans sp.]